MASVGACALVMEWHDEQCPHPNPRAATRAALEAADFEIACEQLPIPNNGTIWALRRG